MNDSTQHLSQVQFQVMDVLMLSIVVLFLGMHLTRRIRFLEINNIPPAVTGGLIISALVAQLEIFAEVKVSFNLELRDFLLLAFFSTIGLAAKLRQRVAGGKALAILIAIAFVFFLLALCIEVGSLVNRLLFAREVHLPGFLTALFVGVIITNLADVLKLKLNQASIDRVGDLSLNLFLAMSLMSMQLMTLANAAGPILFVVMGQMLVITLFVIFVVFRFMGRDDDAAVIAAGFAGMGMGATPVAIANMSAITGRYGPSAKAFLVVPLIGAFFIDIMNAIVIKLFTRLFRTKRPERCHACK